MLKRWFFGSMAAFAALLLSIPAGAVGVGGGGASLFVNGNSVELTNCVTPEEGRLQSCTGSIEGEFFQVPDFQLVSDPDPLVALAFSVFNSSATDQTFSFTAVVPVAAVGPDLIINGSIAGSLTDVAGDGASLLDATGAPLYVALIDGNPVRTLLDAPQGFSTTTSTTIGPAIFTPELFAGAATTFIALQIQFSLSAGDAASFTSVFNVVPVPEPGTLMLLAIGIAGIAARRRSA